MTGEVQTALKVGAANEGQRRQRVDRLHPARWADQGVKLSFPGPALLLLLWPRRWL